MIAVSCARCHEELEQPGALLFTAPLSGQAADGKISKTSCEKWHLCVRCSAFVQSMIDSWAPLGKFSRPPHDKSLGQVMLDELHRVVERPTFVSTVAVVDSTRYHCWTSLASMKLAAFVRDFLEGGLWKAWFRPTAAGINYINMLYHPERITTGLPAAAKTNIASPDHDECPVCGHGRGESGT